MKWSDIAGLFENNRLLLRNIIRDDGSSNNKLSCSKKEEEEKVTKSKFWFACIRISAKHFIKSYINFHDKGLWKKDFKIHSEYQIFQQHPLQR